MGTNAHILLIEDEPHLAQGILFNLEMEGYTVTHAKTGEEGLKLLQKHPFDLMVLDLMLPGIDGLDVCRRTREEFSQLLILILTARAEEEDRVAGLKTGADDYLTKPFSLTEFLLRVKGLLRRAQQHPGTDVDPVYRFSTNELNLNDQIAQTQNGPLNLTAQEVKLLRLFFANEGRVLSRAELLREGWGVAPNTETRTLDNFIVRLRRHFEPDPANPRHFLTVRGRGYKFQRELNDPAP